MIEQDELAAWVRLLETPGVGRESARKLLAAFGSPQAALSASVSARASVIGPVASKALSASSETLDALVVRTLGWVAEKSPEARDVVTLGDPRYPAVLLESPDPPLLLYTQGRTELLAAPSLAVVGSRNPTPQGTQNARRFSQQLSDAGLTIVSGLAHGIDGAAHQGGLEGRSSTVAVVGTGLDRVYPRRHLELARRIAAEGLIASEYAPGTPPLPDHFPNRNRIIAGLSRGTLVVEAALQSGSLITARLALEAGREVFAIPGSIHSAQSRGCHALIRQGAKLVERAEDVLEELCLPSGDTAVPDPAPIKEDPILDALGFEPMTLDELVARTGRSAAELNARLLDLELDGRVTRLPGQLFQRLVHG